MSKTLVGWIGLSLLCALPARGLERVSLPAGDAAPWASASSVTVAYYNSCNGWLWSDVVYPGDQFGVVVESPHPGAVLVACDLLQDYVGTNDTGYGHVATVAVHAVDSQDCPTGAPLASVPWTETENPSGWVTYGFGIPVPDRFALTVTMHEWGGDYPEDGATLRWDHPGAGPTGPPACGVCYPSPRLPHSFKFASEGVPLCPGAEYVDLQGTECPWELVWQARFEGSVGVEPASWARVKSLYR